MLNFASLFNQWRTQNNNGVADILSQPNVNMGRLLDEESFQGQYKASSPKICEFMKYERYQELIDLVTVVGPADDKKRSFKYPLSACQVLCIENNTALDYFLPEKPIVLEDKVEEQVEVEVQVEVEDSSSEKKKEDEAEPEKEIAAQGEKKDKTEEKVGAQEEAKGAEEAKEKDQVEILQETPPEEAKNEEKAAEEVVVKPEEAAQQATPEKKTKKVMKKEMKTVEKIEKREVPALIHKLLGYFEGEINYTLAGYVSKVLAHLLTRKPAELMKYILEEKMMHKVIDHAQSRSVGQLIVKVLTHESTLLLEQRRSFFKELLYRTSVVVDVSVISNLSSYICQVIEKIAANLKGNSKINEFNATFFSLDIITQVIKSVMSDEENVAVYNAPILLTYLTNVPFVLPDDENVVNEFVKLGELFVEKSVSKLQVDKRSRPKLGFGRLKIIEILRFIIKEDVLNSKEIVAKTNNFFPTLFNLVRQYEMNNMLHNEVVKILETSLTEKEDSPLNKAVLRDNVLLNFLNEEWQEDSKIKAGDSVYKYRKGYIAHVINLCVRLRQLSENNESIKRLIENSEFTSIYESFVEKEVFNSKKSLAGLMKKEQKHEILFQKEDILTSHMTFLQKCPSPVYEPEPAPEQTSTTEAPDLVEELQRQLEENMNIKSGDDDKASTKSEPVKKEESPKKNLSKQQEGVEGEGQYWSTHLDYQDIDDLMADL